MEAKSRIAKGPNFLVVGTQKGGTTSMYEILKRHPQIFMPDTKEVHFFDRDEQFKKGVQWYVDENFAHVKSEIAIGEITPNYMFIESVPERIIDTLGANMKFIFIFRNPANRAFSHYQMCIHRQTESRSFADAIDFNLEQIKSGEISGADKHYIDRGFYDGQVERFLKFFQKKNMLFLLFEEVLIDKRKETFDRVYDFLGVDRINISPNVKSLSAAKTRSDTMDGLLNSKHPFNRMVKAIIPNQNLRTNIKYYLNNLNKKKQVKQNEVPGFKALLINDVYRKHILKLQDLIGRDLGRWLE